MRLADARTPRPPELIEAEIKGLEEDFEAARRGIKDGKDKKRQKRFTGI
jgi:hypothetical protein